MKKYFAFLVLGVYATVAFAAVTSEQRIKTDKVVVGRPAPAVDPAIEFQGTTQRIKANRTTGRMQFTNDGTNFKNIGSGSGGAGGVNLLVDDNGDFEAGDTAWTESGGTFSIETTNPLFGVGSGKWDSSASAQTLISNLKTIEKGMVGRTCGAELVYKWPSGVAADLSFQVLDASSNIIFSNDLSPTTSNDTAKSQRNFDCGALGSQYRVRILSNVSNPAEIIIDNVFLGSDNNSFQLSQATEYGAASWAGVANCIWQRTSNQSFADYSADTDCNNPTVYGKASAPGTKVPSIVFTDGLPIGVYEFQASGYFVAGTASANCSFRITDGTNHLETNTIGTNAALASSNVSGRLTVSSALSGPRTFTIQGTGQSLNADCRISMDTATTTGLRISVYRYPLSSAEALTLETTGSSWSGYHDSTCAWTRTNTAYGDPAADATCNLVETQNSGFGTVTSSGSVLPNIVFTPKQVGKYYVCANLSAIGGAGNITSVQLYDSTAAVVVADRQSSNGTSNSNPYILCGIVNVTSISTRTLSIRTAADVSTVTVSAVAPSRSAIEWSIYPISQQFPAPVFTELQNIVKGGENDVKILSATVTNAGSPTLNRQTGAWVNSLTDNGVGDTTINTTSFTVSPSCTCMPYENVATPNLSCQAKTISSTAIRIFTAAAATTTALDRDFSIICVGK